MTGPRRGGGGRPGDRRDGDRRELVVLRIAVVELAAELLDSHVCRADFAQEAKCDRAVGLNDEFAVQLGVGEGFNLDDIADVKAGSALVICSTQDVYALRTSLARLLSMPAANRRASATGSDRLSR